MLRGCQLHTDGTRSIRREDEAALLVPDSVSKDVAHASDTFEEMFRLARRWRAADQCRNIDAFHQRRNPITRRGACGGTQHICRHYMAELDSAERKQNDHCDQRYEDSAVARIETARKVLFRGLHQHSPTIRPQSRVQHRDHSVSSESPFKPSRVLSDQNDGSLITAGYRSIRWKFLRSQCGSCHALNLPI